MRVYSWHMRKAHGNWPKTLNTTYTLVGSEWPSTLLPVNDTEMGKRVQKQYQEVS